MDTMKTLDKETSERILREFEESRKEMLRLFEEEKEKKQQTDENQAKGIVPYH